MIIGYLVSEYPGISHTFIRREVATLRDAGLDIRTYSVRKTGVSADDSDAQAERDHTFVIQQASASSFVGTNIKALAKHPVRYFSTLKLAFGHRVPGLRALLLCVFHFLEAIVLADRLERDGVTRLHAHFANAGATVGMLAAHFRGLPWSLTLHGISEFDYPAGWLLPAKLERADFAACVSYFGMAQAMRLTLPEIWKKLAVVRCAIDPASLPVADRHSRSGALKLICVGRLSAEKGHAGLIGVVQRLTRAGADMHLTLVGDGPQRVTLEALVTELDVRDRVTFAGAATERDTLEAIAKADILVLASFMEGLPIVLIEALAMGIPVVASRVAGIPEVVEEGRTGLLFEPGNWRQLEDALGRLSREPSLRDDLARQTPSQQFGQFFYPDAARPLIGLFNDAPTG
ncbi:glycosyltransferase family 4 protein [Sphingomonas panacisoli]|uniref:Glycosyltransferase family 4 protein n=1 Tax=Sphingomonas panacisoli TaxID=1813879 RepID=A0A5B8LIX6_9SPHN|nr:glycosyltransferase [Sphingomonas panacisoli]QDZ08051.1 glycosyltransferase family 4 protein [Sphingomonas panacisoli]